MMKVKFSIFVLFIVPSIIYGGKISKHFPKQVEEMNKLAANEATSTINGAIKLKEDGFLGDGGFGFVYEGTIINDNRSVAIKFVDDQNIANCEREFELYCYLKAYKNETVEKYGIPAIYYYNRWENYILIALTKFDIDLLHVAQNVTFDGFHPLDILILFRDFVFQTKYIHSHGVRHDDIKPDNIMLRGHRSFLIDLNSSSKMMQDNRGGTLDYECRRFFEFKKRHAIDDYESFLYTINVITSRRLFGPEWDNENRKNGYSHVGLNKIIKAFNDEVFASNKLRKHFPNYDNLEKMISYEISKIVGSNGHAKFSWITTGAETSPVRNIKDIVEPKSIDFAKFKYPPIVHRLPLVHTKQPILTAHTSTPRKKSNKRWFGCFCTKTI